MGNQSSIAVLPINHEEEFDRIETPRIGVPDIIVKSPTNRSSRKQDLDKFIRKMTCSYSRDQKKRVLDKAIQRFHCENMDVAVTIAWTFKYLILIGQFADDAKYTKEIEEMENRFLHHVLQKDMEFWVDKSIFFCRFYTFHKAMQEIHQYQAWDNITL
jgi:hypothetical protein